MSKSVHLKIHIPFLYLEIDRQIGCVYAMIMPVLPIPKVFYQPANQPNEPNKS
jgi:hypothetical protein